MLTRYVGILLIVAWVVGCGPVYLRSEEDRSTFGEASAAIRVDARSSVRARRYGEVQLQAIDVEVVDAATAEEPSSSRGYGSWKFYYVPVFAQGNVPDATLVSRLQRGEVPPGVFVLSAYWSTLGDSAAASSELLDRALDRSREKLFPTVRDPGTQPLAYISDVLPEVRRLVLVCASRGVACWRAPARGAVIAIGNGTAADASAPPQWIIQRLTITRENPVVEAVFGAVLLSGVIAITTQ